MSGDTFQRSPRRPSLLGFNPRPTIMSGDTCQAPCHKHRFLRFNPRPTIMSGDTERHRLLIPFQRVSIHARQLCRAIHAARHGLRNFLPCRIPPRKLWRAIPATGTFWGFDILVSIHARQLCRAIRLDGFFPVARFRFQSTPDNYVGRYSDHRHSRYGQRSFNPRPTIMSGDTTVLPTVRAHPSGFNPRPTIMSGDTPSVLGVHCAL